MTYLCYALKMTRVARSELEDARRLVAKLERGDVCDACDAIYKSAIALLRAVGHKLSYVDGSVSASQEAVIKNHYKGRCQRSKFFNALKKERDRLLKDEVGSLLCISEKVESLAARSTMLLGPTEIGIPSKSHFVVKYHYFVTNGPFNGLDAINVLREGIRFWEVELDWIDKQLEATKVRAFDFKAGSATENRHGDRVMFKQNWVSPVGFVPVERSIASMLRAHMREARLAGLAPGEQIRRGAEFIRFLAPGLNTESAINTVRSIACPSELCED